MNAVEIEEAISKLAEQKFDAASFPYAFLEAFGNKPTTIKRLKSGSSNASDIEGGVLQRNNIHLIVCDEGKTSEALAELKASPTTKKSKAKFILATDGTYLEAESMLSGETVACDYKNFPNNFGFFLDLAGISTIKQIRNNPIDIQATGRLNRLYIELLQQNEAWATDERRAEMNQFMTRLIFCFFAEDTEIFMGDNLFTHTIEQMSDSRTDNTDHVITEIFRAMDTPIKQRVTADLPRWADAFPYVNGGLFAGNHETPKFSRIARSYLIHAGNLNWKEINPDIFGSMIQAVADEDERDKLGMHYTSVPNILKVLNPLFLDDLNDQLEQAGENPRKLLNLKKRMAKIRVFDPACGSGNFLVIAYKNMREIEYKIHQRRNETHLKSDIPLTNFRGIELKSFAAEIARLALIIAEYQCDVLYRGQKDALAEFLPLNAMNWITCGNALRLDWLSVCPPTGTGVKLVADDLFATPLKQTEIDFENEGGETYICGNPPYKGGNWRTKEQTEELGDLLSKNIKTWKALDYVTGWLIKAAEYSKLHPSSSSAFVTTNSICQGIQASLLWPLIFGYGQKIFFAYTSFKWSNLASKNAGVSVIVIGLTSEHTGQKRIFETDTNNAVSVREVSQINAYLLNANNVFIKGAKIPLGFDAKITDGSGALDGGNLILNQDSKDRIASVEKGKYAGFIKYYLGSSEFIRGNLRWCLWIEDDQIDLALENSEITQRIQAVQNFRESAGTRARTAVARPHKFAWINKKNGYQIIVPTVFSERRTYITAGYLGQDYVISNAASIVQNAELHVFAIISSILHMSWVKAIAGKLKTDLRYTSTTCYNTFPVPKLTEKNKADLTKCAEDILLAREAHFPATIADLYKPDAMPENLLHAHARNDEVLERIYIGRRFKNDTERLEKLFDLYTKMTRKSHTNKKATPKTPRKSKKKAS